MISTLLWLGALSVVAAGSGIGFTLAERWRRRPQQLAALRTGLHVLLTEIDIGLTPLPEALQRAGHAVTGPVAALFATAAQHLQAQRGITGGEAWAVALKQLEPELCLQPEELDVLRALRASLGATERGDQRRHLHLAVTRLQAAEDQARAGWRKQHRLSLYLGVIGGAMAALALL